MCNIVQGNRIIQWKNEAILPKSKLTPRIVNGYEAILGQFPHQVNLLFIVKSVPVIDINISTIP